MNHNDGLYNSTMYPTPPLNIMMVYGGTKIAVWNLWNILYYYSVVFRIMSYFVFRFSTHNILQKSQICN
jgi:hypothetical protein